MQVKCSCGKMLKVPDTMAGKQARCPGCNNVFTVPPAKAPAEAAATDDKIIVTCSCGKRLAAPATAIGKQVRCPGCGAAVPVSDGTDGEDDAFELDMPPPENKPREDDYGVAALHCPNCQAELETGAQFCVSCGTHLASGAKHDELDADKVRQEQKSEKLKRMLAIARIVIPIILLVGICWAGWVYVGKKKYNEWKQRKADQAAPKSEVIEDPKPDTPAPTPSKPPADNSPKPELEKSSPLRTERKSGTLGHAPKKVGDEGYLELVVYTPSRTKDKLALISVRRSITDFKTLEGRVPKDLMEVYKKHPFTPAPPGTEYVYKPEKPEKEQVGIRRLRDKPAPKGGDPELD